MKAAELRRWDRVALHAELSALLKAQAGLRIQLATQQLHNTSQLKKIRCEIARVRTILTEKFSASCNNRNGPPPEEHRIDVSHQAPE